MVSTNIHNDIYIISDRDKKGEMEMTLILCNVSDCIYLLDRGEKYKAYRFRCGNDEIEIDLSAENKPCCYSYDKKETEEE